MRIHNKYYECNFILYGNWACVTGVWFVNGVPWRRLVWKLLCEVGYWELRNCTCFYRVIRRTKGISFLRFLVFQSYLTQKEKADYTWLIVQGTHMKPWLLAPGLDLTSSRDLWVAKNFSWFHITHLMIASEALIKSLRCFPGIYVYVYGFSKSFVVENKRALL